MANNSTESKYPPFGSADWHAQRKELLRSLAAQAAARGMKYTPAQIEQSRRFLHEATYGSLEGYEAYPEVRRATPQTYASRSMPDDRNDGDPHWSETDGHPPERVSR